MLYTCHLDQELWCSNPGLAMYDVEYFDKVLNSHCIISQKCLSHLSCHNVRVTCCPYQLLLL